MFDWSVPLLCGGLLLGAAGIVSLAKPLRFLGIRSRRAGLACASLGAVLAVAGLLLLAAGRNPPGAVKLRAGCLESTEPLARQVDEALARFENGGAADQVLGKALLVREKLEQAEIDPGCEVSRREVLISLNHVILGFQRYLARGSRDRDSRAELESILERARAHERRGIAPKD